MKCNDVCAADLRESVQLQRKSRVSDGAGGWVNTWTTYATVRAKVHPLSGRERVFAAQLQSETTHDIVIRYRTDVDAADRIVWRGHEMSIEPPVNVEARDRWLEIRAVIGEPIHSEDVVS